MTFDLQIDGVPARLEVHRDGDLHRFRRATGKELLPRKSSRARAHALASTAGVTTACRRHPKTNQP